MQAGGAERDTVLLPRIDADPIEHTTADQRQVEYREADQDQANKNTGHSSESSTELCHRISCPEATIVTR